ncbi:hypothetical protein NQ315_015831 [Exocentrus adspersus]|uniref:Peptidase M16C associated domain-containing protein n=1 Tax=Exocentrus adspersus TaxID=1586481 RepID=A0AAV8W4P2_9CUCU|nr:hypothetical protein NQ315_015831 [Exocentrus adspersus]
MPPVDKTPNINMGNFQLLHSLQAYNRIPISEYISTKTGLTVVIAEVDGPVVNGYFCLVTEAFDDDGLPHTLEHLIFLGSEEYPYKGVLDLLANRCLASGTNAWTDTDHTCYTMETAGSEGFLTLMPIFLEHILYPVLTDEGFITEVHHITGEGQDAGVVYCEMQGRENSAESRLHLTVARNIYPGKCGYSSETGGLMKNLRESTNNTKVRNYHKEFYRPENLKIIITGQVKPVDVFNSLSKLEDKIISKGSGSPFQRPWQNPVPPLAEDSKELVIKYPADDESNGLFSMAWRGASAVKDLYTVTATNLLLKYLTEFSVSPLPKEFVEIEEPYASKICYNLYENSETCVYISFEDVPIDKLPEIRPKLQGLLKKLLDTKDINMERMESIINRYKLESLSNLENSPHHTVAFMIIGHMLYGDTKEDLQQRVNPLTDLAKLAKEPQSYWLEILRKYFVENKYVAIQCVPSKEEQANMAKEEKERIQAQIDKLGVNGLREKTETLEKAIEFNEREPSSDMLTSVPIPNLSSIKFHSITRYSTDSEKNQDIDLAETPVFTYFDHLKTSFVYIFALLDTSSVPSELRSYLPLLLESLLELPIERDGKIIPYEDVVAQLNDDTVSSSTSIGLLGGKAMFRCGSYSQTCTVTLQVEASKYEIGLRWLRELLYKTVFTAERLKVVAMKMNNSVSQVKRSGRSVVAYAMKGMSYSKDSNVAKNGLLQQNKFLLELIPQLDSDASKEVIDKVEELRKIITEPSKLVLYIASNLEYLKEPAKPINEFLPQELGVEKKQAKLNVTPDYKLLDFSPLNGCIIGMGCLESSFFYQSTKSITSYTDPDLPALMLYLQYLTQAEGPLWKQIRGKGYSYNYAMMVKVNEGLLYLIYAKATNVVGAYKETKDIVDKQLKGDEWDEALLDSAKSSLIFEIIDEEKTIGNVVALSIFSYFQNVDYKFNRTLLQLINKVTIEDLNRVGQKYVAPLFDPSKIKTAVVTDPSKAQEIATGFKKLDLDLKVYPSLEESFLNKL